MLNQEKFISKQHLTKSPTSSSTSSYSTCSDNHNENGHPDKDHSNVSLQSEILSGLVKNYKQKSDTETVTDNFLDATFSFPIPNISNDTNYSISPLDQNLDCLIDKEVFVDCEESIKSDTKSDDSSKYLQLDNLKANNYFYNTYSNLNKPAQNIERDNYIISNSSPTVLEVKNEQARLITIVEETEVTCTNSLNQNRSKSQNTVNNTGRLITNMVDELNDCDKNYCKLNPSKRVLFAHESNATEFVNSRKDVQSKFIKSNTPFSLNRKTVHSQNKNNFYKNSNNHNTTESFVLWEEYLETSDKLTSRKSLSLSDLHSYNDNYVGDDECSTSFKTLDDTFISHYSLETINDSESVQKKFLRHKSKSCESVLKEVKHLPHILYDKFLKYLSREIEIIRKRRVFCNCQKFNKKTVNKENNEKTHKQGSENTLSQNKNVNTGNQCYLTPLDIVTNHTMLSTEIVSKDASKQDSKSPTKISVTPSKKSYLYSWQREIVSPVGEYIKGKRPSPFKSSPAKRII